MEITLRKFGQALFFAPAGRLTVHADLEGLHAAIREISDRDIRGVFLDLENVTRLDCWGIGQLAQIRGQVEASDRTFGLVNVDGYQRRLLSGCDSRLSSASMKAGERLWAASLSPRRRQDAGRANRGVL